MLHTLTAQDFMTRRVITLNQRDSVSDAIRRLGHYKFSGAPVAERNGEFVGVFSEKCCLKILSLVVPPDCRVTAEDIMQTQVISLAPEDGTLEAISRLLSRRISGAPVVDRRGTFQGVFSERTAMRVVLDSVYEQTPVGQVAAYMDRDPDRIISGDTDLGTLIHMFLATPYRRLEVLHDGQVQGQISRRDVIRAALPSLEDSQTVKVSGCNDGFVPVPDRLPVSNVATFMDRNARTITPDVSLLEIAHIFLTTNFRRLPVLEGDRLVGQISRRDLLAAAHENATRKDLHKTDPLYVSGLSEKMPDNLRARM